MQVLRLTLKGFRGIRDGLGRDSLTLDFERLADGAQLVALAGANGRGKTTVMDNMHPYLTMPSRAGVAGPGGFSYYDHVFLPESEKDLIWMHEGCNYHSQVVVRSNGRRRTEAFLFRLAGDGAWLPVVLDDGTVSDGKVDTYTRCVEALCGHADTFFTSVFSAQGKRQLSAYRNAEIKSLLADLLGQDEIRAQGQRAAETARLLKASLAALRQELAGMQEEGARIANDRQRLEGAEARVARCLAQRQSAQATLESARHRHAQSLAQQEQARGTEARRMQLQAECRAANQAGLQAVESLRTQERSEQQRLERLQQRIAERAAQQRKRWQSLQERRRSCLAVLAHAPAVRRAERRLPLAEQVLEARAARVSTWRQQVQDLNDGRGAIRATEQRLAATLREAGQAAIRADDLGRRFGLTNAVPCAGTDLQGQCQLLGDARQARALVPDAQGVIARLAAEKAGIESELAGLKVRCDALVTAPQRLVRAERGCERARTRMGRLAQWAARSGEMAQARESLAAVDLELAAAGPAGMADRTPVETPEERAEQLQIVAARRAIADQVERQSQQLRATLDRLQQALAALPAPFDAQGLAEAKSAMERAATAATLADQAHMDAMRDAEALSALALQARALSDRQTRAASRIAAVDTELSNWNLFARCMSNDGLIALAIDDAGPALSGLANDLLLACYGTRFTVSILTLLETGKGEQKEGFDIVVHDGESGQSKSVGLMSGGERVWISCRSRHEIHYAGNPDMPSPPSSGHPRPCSCPSGTCIATRHNSASFLSATIDPDYGGGKSISLMSGGERTFIEACLTRAIALYIAQHTGRHYGTLFSDEADGPLDPEHKRMFMAMKREVLRLGGYGREFFITQTPHLAAMADAVIDLDAMRVDAHAGSDSALR